MARVFVTGPNGFIGSHLVEYLLERGDEVIGLVRPTSDLRALAPLRERHGSRLNLVTGDIRNRATIDGAVDDIEYVYHLGAVLMAASEAAFRTTNVTGTRNLLDALAARAAGSLRRFLFASAQAAAGPSPDGTPIDESHPMQPVSVYGRSKCDAEAVVREYSDRIPVTIVRPVAVYGERERDISGGTFPMVRAGLAPRLGFAAKTACLVYVGDLVRGMVAAAESPLSVGNAYFLSDPDPYPMPHVVHAMADAMGARLRVPIVVPHAVLAAAAVFAELGHRVTGQRPMLTRDKVRELRQRWWAVTPAAAARDLGWSTQVTLPEGMARAVADWDRRRRQ